MELNKLITETRNRNTMNLDIMSSFEIVKAMNDEDRNVPSAIEKALDRIASAVDEIVRMAVVCFISVQELAEDLAFWMHLNVRRHSVSIMTWSLAS